MPAATASVYLMVTSLLDCHALLRRSGGKPCFNDLLLFQLVTSTQAALLMVCRLPTFSGNFGQREATFPDAIRRPTSCSASGHIHQGISVAGDMRNAPILPCYGSAGRTSPHASCTIAAWSPYSGSWQAQRSLRHSLNWLKLQADDH